MSVTMMPTITKIEAPVSYSFRHYYCPSPIALVVSRGCAADLPEEFSARSCLYFWESSGFRLAYRA